MMPDLWCYSRFITIKFRMNRFIVKFLTFESNVLIHFVAQLSDCFVVKNIWFRDLSRSKAVCGFSWNVSNQYSLENLLWNAQINSQTERFHNHLSWELCKYIFNVRTFLIIIQSKEILYKIYEHLDRTYPSQNGEVCLGYMHRNVNRSVKLNEEKTMRNIGEAQRIAPENLTVSIS